jgi:signal transduction histidine kinase
VALTRFLFVGLGSLVIIAIPTVLAYEFIARDFALTLAAQSGRNLARRVLAPVTTSQAIAGDKLAISRIDAMASARMLDGSVARIKIWDLKGRLIYSDEPALIGRVYTFPEAALLLNASEPTRAKLTPLDDPENEFERGNGQLVEVYSLTKAVTGEQLVFETYFHVDQFNKAHHELMLQMAPVALAALIALSLAQLPTALQLARQVQRDRLSRQRLLEQAATAADHERSRLAQTLHDDVIQDLAGVGYALSSLGQHLGAQNGPAVRRIAMIVHRDVEVLRAMVTELYPSNVDPENLAISLSDLGNELRHDGVHVNVEVGEELGLGKTAATLVYRVARESLHNAHKHGQPRNVTVRLSRTDSQTILTIVDDGLGFDPATPPEEGHFGLILIRDTVAEAGGTLLVDSSISHGTRVELRLPRG